jgi:gliding motility-associated-like protein
MKKLSILIIIIFSFLQTSASHIAGGELFYEYIGPGNAANTNQYRVTMRLFRDCHSNGQTLQTERVVIGIYRTNGLSLYSKTELVLQSPVPSIQLNTGAIPCLVNAPEVCFQIGVFTGYIDLPSTSDGFTLSWIRCCRIDNIGNLGISTGIGGTFVTKIPGQALLPSGNNSSPQFLIKDTALVCQNKNFVLDFGATDPDGDQLTYSFCDAYSGGTSNNPNPGTSPGGIPPTLSLSPLPYGVGYSGQSPLGPTVKINPQTGKITGVAPAAGRYVINVCVTESRNGVAINEHRKDFILQVGDCDYTAAVPVPLTGAYCKDFTVTFNNSSSSANIQSYFWDFGVAGSNADTSSLAQPVFTFPDTGLYKVKLIVRATAGCVDTGTTTLSVYPGFKADFDVTGSCFQAPFDFADKSTANYGVINSWSWNFGDLLTQADSSILKNPAYKYSDTGSKTVSLTVTSSKGCTESITKTVAVTNKPLLTLPFKDTLICSIDTLQLKAVGTGNFAWKPANNIVNPNDANPLVYPKTSTTYTVTLTEKGCVASDSIKVNVLSFISVNAGADTGICSGDSVVLKPASAALQYQWTPASQLSGSSNSKNVVARPTTTTTYVVTANLGKCQAKDSIKIVVAPYPVANAGVDAGICFGDQVQLAGNITGSSFTWSPSNSLVNAVTLTPIAKPSQTTAYVLTVTDTLGCLKAVYDTVIVKVVPKIKAFAGNDTSVVANQPLQLNATGGSTYLWSPSTGMNNTFIANPVVLLGAFYDSVLYKVRVGVAEGCYQEDEVKVKVFKTGPDIFVPTAFTPNHDGKNDFFKPIAVGMKALSSFKVYNRWGQLVYSSAGIGMGWDGTLAGKEQSPGTYVFTADGVDYLGKPVFKKGTVILIR